MGPFTGAPISKAGPIACLLLMAILTGGCAAIPVPHDSLDQGAGPEAASGHTVVLRANRFEPASLEVPMGTTVVWVNEDGVQHSVTPTDHGHWGLDESNAPEGEWLDRGQTWTYTFAQLGSYDYYCIPHSWREGDGTWRGMTGRIVVVRDA